MWEGGGKIKSYIYHQNRKSNCGDSELFEDGMVAKVDVWNRITERVVINDPGKNNWVFSSSSQANQQAAGGVDGTLTATLTVDHVSTSGSEVLLPLDVAIPCGLVANELISNALRHAFRDEQHGRINVTLNLNEDDHAVAVRRLDDALERAVLVVRMHEARLLRRVGDGRGPGLDAHLGGIVEVGLGDLADRRRHRRGE